MAQESIDTKQRDCEGADAILDTTLGGVNVDLLLSSVLQRAEGQRNDLISEGKASSATKHETRQAGPRSNEDVDLKPSAWIVSVPARDAKPIKDVNDAALFALEIVNGKKLMSSFCRNCEKEDGWIERPRSRSCQGRAGKYVIFDSLERAWWRRCGLPSLPEAYLLAQKCRRLRFHRQKRSWSKRKQT